MPANQPTHYRVKDIAQQRKVKPSVILHWIASGELSAVDCSARPGGRPRWRVSREALEAFDLKRSIRPTPTVKRIRRRRSPDAIQFF